MITKPESEEQVHRHPGAGQEVPFRAQADVVHHDHEGRHTPDAIERFEAVAALNGRHA